MMKVFQFSLVLLVFGLFVNANNSNINPKLFPETQPKYSSFRGRDKNSLTLGQFQQNASDENNVQGDKNASKVANNARLTRSTLQAVSCTSARNLKPRPVGERQNSDISNRTNLTMPNRGTPLASSSMSMKNGKSEQGRESLSSYVGNGTNFTRNTRLTSSMNIVGKNRFLGQDKKVDAWLERNKDLLGIKPREGSLSRNPSVESVRNAVTLSKTSSHFSSTASISSISGRPSRRTEFNRNHQNQLLNNGAPSTLRSTRSQSIPVRRRENSISSSTIEKSQFNPARRRESSVYSMRRKQLVSADNHIQKEIPPFVLLVENTLQIDGFSSNTDSVEASIQSEIESKSAIDQLLLASVVITDKVVQLINASEIKKLSFDDCRFELSLIENLNVDKLEEFHLINTNEDVSSVICMIIPRLNSKLVHLNLSGNVLYESSQQSISKFISLKESKLVTLNLSGTGLNSKSLVLSSIFRSSTIEHLYLAKNSVGSMVLHALRRYDLNWKTLDISYNSIKYEDKMFDSIGTVESLDISYCFADKDVSMLLMNKRNLQSVNYSGNYLSKEFEKDISKSYVVFHLELSIARELALQKNGGLTDFGKLSSVYVPFSKSKIIHDNSIVKSATFDDIKSNSNFDSFKEFIVASKNLNEIHIDQWLIDEVDTSKNNMQFTTIRSLTIDTLVSKSKNKHKEFLKFLFTLFPNTNRLELGSNTVGAPFYFPPFESLPLLPPISHLKLKKFRLAGADKTNFFFYLEKARQLKTLHLSNVTCPDPSTVTHRILVRTLLIDCVSFLLSIAVEYLINSMPDIYFLKITNAPTGFMQNQDKFLKTLKNLRKHEIEPNELYLSSPIYRKK